MGFSVSWIAVRTDRLDELFAQLGAEATSETDECFESDLAGVQLPDGWYLLQGRGCDHPMISEASLSRTSTLGETVACSIEEHVMFSSAEYWQNGTRSWSITHAAENGMFDLATTGFPPNVYDTIKVDLVAAQHAKGGEDADVDMIFDIPLQVARSLCGYRHDEPPDWRELPVVFSSIRPAKKPWWKPCTRPFRFSRYIRRQPGE
ncbi:MAG: hypothetical protein QNJ00_07720 [Woeseiaceae bacterium]|nr:hypothetical protein [Woeseiaceae bacterium]